MFFPAAYDLDGLGLIGQFYGVEKNEKKFLHTKDGKCGQGHSTRTEEESFQVMKLTVPDTDRELSSNNIVANHYAEIISLFVEVT